MRSNSKGHAKNKNAVFTGKNDSFLKSFQFGGVFAPSAKSTLRRVTY